MRSPELREQIKALPAVLEQSKGNKVWSMTLGFDRFRSGPPTEAVIEIMTSLGRHADDVGVKRAACEYIRVTSSKLVNVRRTALALAREFGSVYQTGWFGDFPGEVLHPPSETP